MNEPRFLPNALVIKRDGDGTVGFIRTNAQLHAGEYWYLVQIGAFSENCRETDLIAHRVVSNWAELLAGEAYGGPDAFRRQVTTVKLKTQLTDTLYAYGASKTSLLPYQFVPLLKFLASPYRRILIADEVGLGKTIEAGYILQEELARGRSARVLVVCPASLRRKWRDEMLNRFNRQFDILDASGARTRIPISDDERRTAHPLRAIVSLQSIRDERFIQAIHSSAAPLDLLIVDEAHHCRNAQTFQSRAVSALIEQSDSVVFLSATPIQTSELNLFTLLNLLVPEEFPSVEGFRQRLELNKPIVRAETLIRAKGVEKLREAARTLREIEKHPNGRRYATNPLYCDLLAQLDADVQDSASRRVELQEQLSEINLLSNIFTRTKRKDVQTRVAQRQAVVPKADLSPYEQSVYDAISDFIFEKYEERHGDVVARLVLVTYQRQIASSLPAAVKKFLAIIRAAEASWNDEIETPEDELQLESVEKPEAKYSPATEPEFRKLIGKIDLKRLENEDTKYAMLIAAIREQQRLHAIGERRSRKMIVFSYFRRSLDYLEHRLLRDHISLVRIDGSVANTPDNPDTDERGRRIDLFRSDATVDVLVTSEVSSEGIDLQFCDTIVNWDLPWNPMVIEQRIGRIDRIGQLSPKIFIINLACQGTIEARILHRLYDRIGIFEHSIGELEPILGEIVRGLEADLFRPHLRPEQQEMAIHAREIAIENQRQGLKALEDQASVLIGHDQFFRNKLDNIQRFGRYVGGDELRLFVQNELCTAIPGLELEPDQSSGLYHLPHRTELERLIDQSLPTGDSEALRFLSQLRRGGVLVTFDGDLADKHDGVDPVHSQHPLVRALAARLDDESWRLPQVARIRLATNLLSPGARFFTWALVTESGFLEARSLMCAVVNLESATTLDTVSDDNADQLLAEMIRDGKPWSNFRPPSVYDAAKCMEIAESHLRDRVDDLDRRRRSRLESIKQVRHSTVEATYSLRIQRQRERTDEMESRAASRDKGAERILPAYRARLDLLETERDVQIERIDKLKLGTVSYQLLGAGFVDVIPSYSPGVHP